MIDITTFLLTLLTVQFVGFCANENSNLTCASPRREAPEARKACVTVCSSDARLACTLSGYIVTIPPISTHWITGTPLASTAGVDIPVTRLIINLI